MKAAVVILYSVSHLLLLPPLPPPVRLSPRSHEYNSRQRGDSCQDFKSLPAAGHLRMAVSKKE